MNSSADQPNPYDPPIETDVAPTAASQRRGKNTALDLFLLTLLAIATSFCAVAVGASIYEVVTMPVDAYGMHRSTFVNAYVRAGVMALVFGLACVGSMIRVRQSQPLARITAVVVLIAMLVVYLA